MEGLRGSDVFSVYEMKKKRPEALRNPPLSARKCGTLSSPPKTTMHHVVIIRDLIFSCSYRFSIWMMINFGNNNIGIDEKDSVKRS